MCPTTHIFLSHSNPCSSICYRNTTFLQLWYFFFFLVSWQNWLVLWIWMQVGVSQSFSLKDGIARMRWTCVLFLDFRGMECHSSRKRSRNARRRTSHSSEICFEQDEIFFFSLHFRKRKKCSKWQKVALWYRIDPMVPYIRARATYLKWSTIAFYFLNVSQLLWSDKLTGDGDK